MISTLGQCRHLGSLSLLVLATLHQLANAQSASRSVAQCVSTPGVNLQLLSACESLRTQLTRSLTAGGSIDLSTEIQLTPTSTTASGSGLITSGATSGTAQTSAVATDGGSGESSTSARNDRLGNSARSSSSQAAGGLGNQPSSASIDDNPTSASASSASSSGIDSGLGAGSTGANDNGNSPSNTAGSNGGSPSSTGTAGAAGAQNSNTPGATESTSNSDPHHYRNTVVIPAAVAAAVVFLLLLALLACCLLLMRRRNNKKKEAALLADAGNEKYSNAHGTSHATAVGSAAPAAGAVYNAGHSNGKSNPFADPVGTNGNDAVVSGGAGGHHGIGAGTAAGLGAGALAGAGAAGIASHRHDRREPSAQRSSMSSTRSPVGVRASGIAPAYTAFGTSSDPRATSPTSHDAAYAAYDPRTSNPRASSPTVQDGLTAGTSAGLAGIVAGTAGYEHGQHQPPATQYQDFAGSRYPDTNAPLVSHDSHRPGNTGLGMGLAGGLGVGAGAAGLAGHQHPHQPSTPSNYSSAASQQNAFHGFSGANTPLAVSPTPPLGNTPRNSNLGAPAAAGLGGVGAAGATRFHQHGRDTPSNTSSFRSDRPPTLPPMDPDIGTGSWISPDYRHINTSSMPRDPAMLSSSDYGDTPERSHPPAHYTQPDTARNVNSVAPVAPTAGLEDPFKTPPRSIHHSSDIPPPTSIPAVPNRSPIRGPGPPPQPQFAQAQQRPRSPLDGGSKASRVLGLDSGSGRASPTQGHRRQEVVPTSEGPATTSTPLTSASPPAAPGPSTTTNAQAGRWKPPAVGEVIEGPFRGSGYVTPHVGLEEGVEYSGQSSISHSPPPSAANGLDPRVEGGLDPRVEGDTPRRQQMSSAQTSAQYTSYPSEDEVRSFDFGSSDEAANARSSVARKPVGGL